MSLATHSHARVVKFKNILQQPCRVDTDHFEAPAVRSNLVLQCGEKNGTPPSTQQNTDVGTKRAQCCRSSRLLQFFMSENYKPGGPSTNTIHDPPAQQVNLP